MVDRRQACDGTSALQRARWFATTASTQALKGRRLRILETYSNVVRSGLTFGDHRDAIIEKIRTSALSEKATKILLSIVRVYF